MESRHLVDGTDDAIAAREALERQSKVRHDLRAPLAVLFPLVSLMLDAEGFTESQRDQLRTLERNVRRLDGMISSVAASGWFDCCASPLALGPVALGAVVGERVAAQRLGGYEGPALQARVAPGVPDVLADRDRVRQIVADLLDNAARFAPLSGPVLLSVEPASDGRTVTLTVADRGPGIPAAELPEAAEFGFRGSAAKELDVPGLGLGLWASRRLAEQMKGGLVVESEAGSGTTVSLTLPVVE